MEQNNKKIITVAFALAGLLAGYLVNALLGIFGAAFAVVARIVQLDVVQHGLPVVVGIATFAILQFHPKLSAWGNDVVSEIRKVVWRTPKETSALTVVVCILLIICGLFFAAIDFVSTKIINYLISF